MNEVQLRLNSVSKDVLTSDQLEVFGKALAVVDRNPIINWVRNDPNHNCDFCIIEGSIAITRNFALKLAHLNTLNLHVRDPQFLDNGVCVVGRLWNDKQQIEAVGACDFAEIKGKRKMHDAATRATTRMLKRALETMVGLPFLNLLIKELFGGFEVTGDPPEEKERDVTPRDETGTVQTEVKSEVKDLRWVRKSPPECREMIEILRSELAVAIDIQAMPKGEAEIWWSRVKTNCLKHHILKNLYNEINRKNQTRKDVIEKADNG